MFNSSIIIIYIYRYVADISKDQIDAVINLLPVLDFKPQTVVSSVFPVSFEKTSYFVETTSFFISCSVSAGFIL